MELNKFISDFANLFDDTDESEITATTVFKDLEEWSSLSAMGIIAMAKLQYGKIITGKEIRSCVTIMDLYNLMLAK